MESIERLSRYEFGNVDKATWMWWLACLGGLSGMSVGFGLAWITETSWPMNVGGLPTFAWWPNLIIIFELTMLGSILATVATLVVSALLPAKGGSLYDPAVTVEGKRLVGVENPPEASGSDLERNLGAPPGALVKTV